MNASINAPEANTACAICGVALRCGAIGNGTQPDATCWCMTEEKLPASARHPGQGCRCKQCLRKAIAQVRTASESN
ncbi:cysteine-rich CWC family protein [Ralstonia sp. ASV6]|uniref:cysteine-rich CWC family protein n=1 Tax=Ralstonia sp. ASV6 TaxID=2795124 RepID=UPI0018EA3BA8|nr:cysteine-rich CWC family protein [Ralstonia sp. ASV6]